MMKKYFDNEDFSKKYNPNQKNAIIEALDFTKTVTIINGPPGTGKTYTSLAIMSIL